MLNTLAAYVPLIALGLTAVGGATKVIFDWRRDKRAEGRVDRETRETNTASVISSQKSVIDDAFRRERVLRRRIDELDSKVAAQQLEMTVMRDENDRRIADQREQFERERHEIIRDRAEQRAYYERELEAMRVQVSELAAHLEDLRQQLSPNEGTA